MKPVPRILVVDPDEEEKDLVAATGKFLGADVAWCKGSEDAFREIADRGCDAILLDILLDDSSGYELCRALKSDADTADVPILFATARHRAEDVLDGFQSLAFDFLVKPYRPRELRARLHNALRLKSLLDEMKTRARFSERVLRLGRVLDEARDVAEAEPAIARELVEVADTFHAEGVAVEAGGRTLFSVGRSGGPVAAEMPFHHSGIEGVLRLWRRGTADPEERVRLADLCAILARGISHFGTSFSPSR